MEEEPLKRCPRCGRFLPLSSFCKNSSKPDGHNDYCFPCGREVVNAYRDRTREALMSDPNHHLHGRITAYDLGCRCDRCMEAWEEKKVERAAKKSGKGKG